MLTPGARVLQSTQAINKMGHLLHEPDAQKNLGIMLQHIVKLNNIISRASQNSGAPNTDDCAHNDLIFTARYAHTIVDANALDEESSLTDSDIDLLMLIGDGMSGQQIIMEVGWDQAQISRWQEEIVRKARLKESVT